MKLLVLALIVSGAVSQSVKSCGGPNDHLKNPVIKLTPDPPVKGGTLTIQASGTLDEAIGDFNTNMDLKVKALGVVSVSVSGGLPLSISPAAVQGPFSLTVGPFALPTSVPGSLDLTGQIKIVNSKNEAVMCIELDLNVPGSEDVEPLALAKLEAPAVSTVSSCGKATDHIPDFKVGSSGGAITMTGTLDEAVTKMSIDLDVSLKVLFITVPLKMTLPLTTSAGLINKGAIKMIAGPSTVAISPNVKATMKGTMKMNDGNSEEIACVNVDTVVSGTNDVVV